MGYPLGAVINAALQTVVLALLLVGLRYGARTRRAMRERSDRASSYRKVHMDLMTAAVGVSGAGLLLWMLPNFLLGWNYGATGLGYGSGGVASYLEYHGTLLPHWYLIVLHVATGSVAGAFGVYLVLRMRWKNFPRAWSIRNYRGLMIFTWIVWFLNIWVGYAILYYFALVGTG